VEINRDFTPIAYYNQLKYWLSFFRTNYFIVFVIFSIPFIIILARIKPLSLGLFAGGFAASGAEIVILIAFQIIFGYAYYMAGIIITLFMLGLALGAGFAHLSKRNSFVTFLRLQSGITVYSIILPYLLILLNATALKPAFTVSVIAILILAISFAAGALFSLAAAIMPCDKKIKSTLKNNISSTAGEAYSADLFGSALGALIVSALLIPLLGIVLSCLLIAAFNIIAFSILFLSRERYII
jgi:spermidine synthase